MKKIISIIISSVMCIGCLGFMPETFPKVSIHASATITDSGICGENLRWVFSEGVLTISGIGEMENYYKFFYDQPWKYYENLIKSVIIEKGVTRIGDNAFYGCENLTLVNVSESVTSIGEYAFHNTPWLDARKAENPLVVLNNILIDGRAAEGDVIIPDYVTSIGNRAFGDCTGLTSVIIGNSVTSIGDWAFASCSALTTVTISDSVTRITANMFYETPWLNTKRAENPLVIVNNILVDGSTSTSDIVIPYGVTSIEKYTFASCSELTSVIIPDGVKSIGDGAFSWCSLLTSATIPDSVLSIGEGAFTWCPMLATITIPDSVTSIGDNAFFGCASLTHTTIPNSVTSIGIGAFGNCKSLTSVTIKNADCAFCYTFEDEATIYGYTGSTAEAYAIKYDRTFVSLDDAPVITGDINGDGNIDIADATMVLMMYAYSAAGMDMSEYTEEQLTAADVDGDGNVTLSDATFILTYYAQNAAGMNPSWEDILKQ